MSFYASPSLGMFPFPPPTSDAPTSSLSVNKAPIRKPCSHSNSTRKPVKQMCSDPSVAMASWKSKASFSSKSMKSLDCGLKIAIPNARLAPLVFLQGRSTTNVDVVFPHQEAITFDIDVSFGKSSLSVTRTLLEIVQLRRDIELFVNNNKSNSNASIPELPRYSEPSGEPTQFIQLEQKLIYDYRLDLEQWFKKVTSKIPHDSAIWGRFFLWDPESGSYVIHMPSDNEADDEKTVSTLGTLGAELEWCDDASDFRDADDDASAIILVYS